ncbi:putative inner membrane protein [Pararobbsia alpina]|uniref:DUF805 domain-containing protein n=1 Tax=Pararobbsia alpina TaxID=621374 RepID=UPI0039A42023
MDWYLKVLKSYAVFEGRARRKEYWMFLLFNFIATMVLIFVDVAILRVRLLSSLYSLAVLVPSIAVGVRRLHDTDRTGWWMLVIVIPGIGWIILLVLMAMEGTRGPNRFGPDPVQEPFALSY